MVKHEIWIYPLLCSYFFQALAIYIENYAFCYSIFDIHYYYP